MLGYHYPFYRDILVEIGVGHPFYLIAREKKKIVGVLPAFRRNTLSGAVYNSLPFFGPNAGVLCADDEKSAEIHTSLLKEFLHHAQRNNALSCSIYTPFLFDRFELYDAIIPNAVVMNRFTQYSDLRTASWSKKIQYDLRKTQKLGIKISKNVTPEYLEQFYAIYNQNCQDNFVPLKPKKCIQLLASDKYIGKFTDIYFAFHNGTMIGGLLVLFSPITVSYYIPCTLPGAKTLQPGTLLIDEAVRDARARGIQFWNWESSPSRESGVYRFKKKWGAEEKPYRIYVQPFQPKSKFCELGVENIRRDYPYYFVYPFDDCR